MEDPLSVRPEQLLKDLGALWIDLGKEETAGSDRSAGVLRAVTMTFILGIAEGEDEIAASETLALLMHDHPSRAIVLKLRRDVSSEIDGRAFAQCWMPFGRRQQICCEQIELSAGSDHFQDMLSLLRGLIAPDLPVVFWCRSAELFSHASFAGIAAMADKIILDSRNHQKPAETLSVMDRNLKAGQMVGDLTWARLTRWRQTVSTAFERLDCQSFFHQINRVVIQYTHAPEPMVVAYLSAWLKSILGLNFPVERVLVAEDVSWQIRGLQFETPLTDIVIERSEKGIVESHIRGFTTRSVFEELDEVRLVREELAILGRDPIFARVVEIASQS